MIDLKEAAKNPAYTLSAMLYGLQNPIETKDVKYEVDMKTFGAISVDGSTCYGCAATSALEFITGRSFAEQLTPEFMKGNRQSRAGIFGTKFHETSEFEIAIDSAREGYFHLIMDFFGYKYNDEYDDYDGLMWMETKNWRQKVPAFEGVIERMHKDYPEWEQFKTIGRTE